MTVKRYDPINSDGTCGICLEDPDYGAYVEFADYDALQSLNAELLEALESAIELIRHGSFAEGCCMCGSPVDSHGIGDGHSPVDAGEYYAGQVVENSVDIIAKARGQA